MTTVRTTRPRETRWSSPVNVGNQLAHEDCRVGFMLTQPLWTCCSPPPPFSKTPAGGSRHGNFVAVEVSIRGTFTGPFETPAGVIRPTTAKLDIP